MSPAVVCVVDQQPLPSVKVNAWSCTVKCAMKTFQSNTIAERQVAATIE